MTIYVPVTNHGTLATTGSGSLTVSKLQTNSGTVQAGSVASDTGTLTLGETWSNAGSLVVNGGVLVLGGTWSSTGTMVVNGGTLNLAGTFATTGLGTMSYTAGTVSLTGTLNNADSTLTLGSNTGAWTVNGGKIQGGTIAGSDGTWLKLYVSTLDGVTLDANATLLAGGTTTVRNGLTLNSTIAMPNSSSHLYFTGSQSLAGTGQIVVGWNSDIYVSGTSSTSPATLNVGTGVTIRGQGVINRSYTGDSLVNEGTIQGDASGATLTVSLPVTNHGTLATSGAGRLTVSSLQTSDGTIRAGSSSSDTGILTLDGTWSSTGSMAVNGGTLNLSGSFTLSGEETYSYTGGTVNLTGILDNTNSTLTLGSNTGVWTLNGTILGGTIAGDSGTWLKLYYGTLDGVVLNVDTTVSAAVSPTVKNGLTLNSTLSVPYDSASHLYFTGSQNLTGTGEIVVGWNAAVYVSGTSSTSPATLTVGAGISIHGEGLITGGYTGDSLVNGGTLRADLNSRTLTVSVPVTNHGTVTTSSSAILSVTSLVNTGTVAVSDSATMAVTDFSNSGTVSVSNAASLSVVNLTNSGWIQTGFSTDDTGTLTLSGARTNAGTIVVMGAATMNWQSTALKAKAATVSGTELLLPWRGLVGGADATYSIETSQDGANYAAVDTVTAADSMYVVTGLQPNTSYHVRVVAEHTGGGREIYDSGVIATLNTPDTSGWYRVTSVTRDSDGSVYSEGTSWKYAGSAAGVALMWRRELGGVTDGSVPTVSDSSSTASALSTLASYAMASSDAESSGSGDGKIPASEVHSKYEQPEYSPVTFDAAHFPYIESFPVWFTALTVNIAQLCGAPAAPQNESEDPIRYFDGAVDYVTTDLESSGLGDGFAQSRSWTIATQWSAGERNGTGWINDSVPVLKRINGDSTIAIVKSSMDIQSFVLSNGQYEPTSYVADNLVHADGEFVFTDAAGNQYRFYDFSSSTPTGRKGQFKSMTDAGGLLTYVAAWTSDGAIGELRRQDAAGVDAESWLYSYLSSSDPNAGLLASVQLRQADGQGGWTLVRQVVYQYYGNSDPNGHLGDLKTAATQDASGNVLGTSYYRYYTTDSATGYIHGLKYALDEESYARLCAAVGNPDLATDAQVAPYAQHYFQYDRYRRVTRHDVQGWGGTDTGGIGTYTYAYATSNNRSGVNSWQYKTIETLPDGNRNLLYSNSLGQVMLKVFQDLNDSGNPALSGQEWLTYYQYDTLGRLLLKAEPSAVTGYDETSSDLLVNQNGNYLYLADDAGLIYRTDFYSTTTATATTAGGVAGYFQASKLQHGEQGTPVLQETKQYYARTAAGRTIYPVATDTVYRNSDGTGAQTTSYGYTWHTDTVRAESVTESLPIVTAAQNGPGTADTTIVYYDLYGQPVWLKDADGYISYTAYDNLTGAVIKAITDVNTQATGDFTGLPTGWATLSGAGLALITTMEVDALGRTTKVTDPNGSITYIVYNDRAHEVRTYVGWNPATHTTTGPIQITREYWPEAAAAAGEQTFYTETLTSSATPTYDSVTGAPTGLETIDETNIRSLTRSLTNQAGQVVEIDEYFSLAGVSYLVSTAHLGTPSNDSTTANYHATLYAYNRVGLVNRVQDSSGKITLSVYDSLARLTSVLVGTNDSAGFSNMVAIEDYVYDNGGVGDGNLTQSTVHPGAGQPDVVTQCVYDWRNRLIAAKEGAQASEDTSTNRPITYQVLDNLGEVVQRDVYDGDGVSLASLGTTNGVPNAPSSSLLRARTATAYDEQGRAYQLTEAVIDQASGNVLSTRTTNSWYDHRGNRIKSQSPTGSVTKDQYDGAGRLVLEATTDGGGDATWADALNLTGDDVLQRTQYQYDAAGNVTTVTDGLSHSTTCVYDDANRLTSQTDATDATTTYTYDAGGNLYTLTDPDENTTTWAYDLLGRTIQETTSLGTRSFTYNSAGDVTRKTDRNGRVTTYTYNSLGQQTAETWLDAQGTSVHTISYTYDTIGDLLTASDAAASYAYNYDALDRVTAVSQTIAGLAPTIVFAQQFDALGNRIQLASTIAGTPDFVTDYTYNGVNEITSVTQHGMTGGNAVAAKRIDVNYTTEGRLSTITRYADLAGTQQVATSTYTFDDAYRLVGLSYTKGTTTLASYAYTYDDAGNMTGMTTVDGTTTYTYDNAGQLVSADSNYTDDEAYTYDDNGNRVTANGDSYTTGTDNRLLSDGTHAYTYDAEGNRTAKFLDTDADGVLDAGDTDITIYTWDYRNRLTEVEHFAAYGDYTAGTSNQTVTYAYDVFNHLIGRTLDADGTGGTGDIKQTVYVYDGDQIALQFDKTSPNGSTSALSATDLSHRYLWNPQAVDHLFADEEVADDEVLFALTDHQNTIRDLAVYDPGTDTTTVASHRVYDAYGNVKSETNSALDCLFGYTGRLSDEATGLQNNLNRWYDPTVGRWLNQDPIGFGGGDANLSRYVGNSPVLNIDPTGLDWLDSTSDFFGGFGDTVTFGLTQRYREAIGADQFIDKTSGMYQGGQVAGEIENLGLSIANPCAAGGWAGAGLRAVNGMQAAGNAANAASHAARGCYEQAARDALGAFSNVSQMRRTCFAVGTPLLTPDGAKPIEEFKVGDLLLSAPEDDPNGPVAPRRVEEIFRSLSRVVELGVGGQTIRTTHEHPFYVEGKGWTQACALSAGDLLRSHNGQHLPVESMADTDDDLTVYNMRIEEYHTYFVGCAEWGFDIWSHNANCAPGEFERGPGGARKHTPGHRPEHIKQQAKAQDAAKRASHQNATEAKMDAVRQKWENLSEGQRKLLKGVRGVDPKATRPVDLQ
jgi:RHS repeat-associated protein